MDLRVFFHHVQETSSRTCVRRPFNFLKTHTIGRVGTKLARCQSKTGKGKCEERYHVERLEERSKNKYGGRGPGGGGGPGRPGGERLAPPAWSFCYFLLLILKKEKKKAMSEAEVIMACSPRH